MRWLLICPSPLGPWSSGTHKTYKILLYYYTHEYGMLEHFNSTLDISTVHT